MSLHLTTRSFRQWLRTTLTFNNCWMERGHLTPKLQAIQSSKGPSQTTTNAQKTLEAWPSNSGKSQPKTRHWRRRTDTTRNEQSRLESQWLTHLLVRTDSPTKKRLDKWVKTCLSSTTKASIKTSSSKRKKNKISTVLWIQEPQNNKSSFYFPNSDKVWTRGVLGASSVSKSNSNLRIVSKVAGWP